MEYLFKVGISLRLGETPDENLRALIAGDMEHVEVVYEPYCDDPAWTTLVREKLDSTSVNINSVHAPFSREVDISLLDDGEREFALHQIGKSITVAELLGASKLVFHGSAEPIEENERELRMAQSKSSIGVLSKQAQSSGVRLALELLPRTCLGNTVEELRVLLDDVPAEVAGICLDSNHPADPNELCAIAEQLGDRIITLHASDYDGIHEKHWLPFNGVVDWGAYANTLRGIQYSGAFIYETSPEADTMEEKLKIVKSNFQRILNTAADLKSTQN